MTNLILPLAAVGVFIVVFLFAWGLCVAAHAGDLLLRNSWEAEEYDPDVREESRRQRARQH